MFYHSLYVLALLRSVQGVENDEVRTAASREAIIIFKLEDVFVYVRMCMCVS